MRIRDFILAAAISCVFYNGKAQSTAGLKQPDRITLTWSDDPSRTQSVSWRTAAKTDNIIGQIAEEQSSPDIDAKAVSVTGRQLRLDRGDGEDFYHQVTFRDLKPGTTYIYRVGDGSNWSAWNQFRTAAQSGDFSFIYLGDAQNDLRSRWSRTIRRAFQQEANARFIVHAGDLINRSNNDDEWAEWHEGAGFIHQMIPAVPTPGNHEYRRDSLERLVLDPHWNVQFNLPKNGPQGLQDAVYYLDYQDLRMVSLNSQLIMLDSAAAQKQERWLEMVLSASPKKWTIVVMHHPVYSTAKNRDNTILRERFKPIFEKYGVDLVLQGHDHTYARGSLGRKRPVYLLSVAGPKMYASDSERWMDVRASDTQLYQVIKIKANKLYVASYKLNGQLFDSFELSEK
ncbi:purple acid phosphatase family protein [Sphingobacterium thalpophilum]|uniref:Cyclic 3',5'-adenosine monophosphate phosphodiesterase n=1 Tax=Sphingobacterium thalpophilum TaxID=259 RepID=A0A4U9UE99_9SPHI|nr:metallophosphoesterase family protein [Sphingobacterium thalpophilum]VTR31600.1 cyclic 3',5'-adenosine monophosphate phosphodiesterase [Sphingobacterium thalpophilum]